MRSCNLHQACYAPEQTGKPVGMTCSTTLFVLRAHVMQVYSSPLTVNCLCRMWLNQHLPPMGEGCCKKDSFYKAMQTISHPQLSQEHRIRQLRLMLRHRIMYEWVWSYQYPQRIEITFQQLSTMPSPLGKFAGVSWKQVCYSSRQSTLLVMLWLWYCKSIPLHISLLCCWGQGASLCKAVKPLLLTVTSLCLQSFGTSFPPWSSCHSFHRTTWIHMISILVCHSKGGQHH